MYQLSELFETNVSEGVLLNKHDLATWYDIWTQFHKMVLKIVPVASK